MTKHVLFVLLLSSFFACESKEDTNPVVLTDNNKPVVVLKESLGTRSLSWLSPYVGKAAVTFEDSLGGKQVFNITKSATSQELHSYIKTIEGETFTLSLTNTRDGNQIFAFKPIGKDFILFGNTLKISQDSNYLRLQFARFWSEESYWVVFSSALNKAPNFLKYTYSPNYPVEGGDSFIFNVDTGVTIFYKSLSMSQSKGIDFYFDSNGVKWKQTLIQ